jgi:hypothetical protein
MASKKATLAKNRKKAATTGNMGDLIRNKARGIKPGRGRVTSRRAAARATSRGTRAMARGAKSSY